MTASITDVAERAGVSVATVSRALRSLPNVAESTRKRVLQAATELDYVVNPNASRLAAGHTHTVAVVVPYLTGWYFQNVLAGAQSILELAGYDMLLYTLPSPDSRDRFLRQLPFRKRVDGVLLIDIPLTDPEMLMLSALDARLVIVGGTSPHVPGVYIDDRAAARRATEYLLDLGHRRIGLISGLQEDPMRFKVGQARRNGWMDALCARDITPDSSWEHVGDFRMLDGAEGVERLMQRVPGLSAVFCLSDEMAIGAMHAIHEHGLLCPEDISIVGFDDHDVSGYLGLTTVSQPMRLMGRTAAEMLLARVKGLEIAHFPRQLPTSLVVRESAAAFVGAEP